MNFIKILLVSSFLTVASAKAGDSKETAELRQISSIKIAIAAELKEIIEGILKGPEHSLSDKKTKKELKQQIINSAKQQIINYWMKKCISPRSCPKTDVVSEEFKFLKDFYTQLKSYFSFISSKFYEFKQYVALTELKEFIEDLQLQHFEDDINQHIKNFDADKIAIIVEANRICFDFKDEIIDFHGTKKEKLKLLFDIFESIFELFESYCQSKIKGSK